MEHRETNSDDRNVEHILARLREGVINGSFPPRSKLLPKVIAAARGTSFLPVVRLIHEGIVASRPVTPLEPDAQLLDA